MASASSSYSGFYPASAVNNGDRAGLNNGAGGVWKDATVQSFPDWVQIDFSGAKTIDHVIVYSVQDNDSNPVEPSDTLTFTQRGITAFEVQSWNGAAWVSLGTVSGNNLVKRNVAFSATTTSRIRVLINAVSNGRYSLVAEIDGGLDDRWRRTIRRRHHRRQRPQRSRARPIRRQPSGLR